MYWNFNDPQHFARAAMLLIASWEAGEATEVQTASLLGVDRLAVRDMRLSCLDAARRAWEKYREQHPPVKS